MSASSDVAYFITLLTPRSFVSLVSSSSPLILVPNAHAATSLVAYFTIRCVFFYTLKCDTVISRIIKSQLLNTSTECYEYLSHVSSPDYKFNLDAKTSQLTTHRPTDEEVRLISISLLVPTGERYADCAQIISTHGQQATRKHY